MGRLPPILGYDLVRELGRGGMGIAFEAVRNDDARRVVLKMILTRDHPCLEQLARFRIEAAAASCLDHPNIVQLFGCTLWQGCPVLIFEFVGGGTLADRIAGRPQGDRYAAEVTSQLCHAIQHAHARGILHRDLKPANVLLTEDGTPKVADFGLAKFVRPIAAVSDEYCMTIGQADDWDRELKAMFRAKEWQGRGQPFLDYVVEKTIDQYAPSLPSGTTPALRASARQFATDYGKRDTAGPEIADLLSDLTRGGGVMGSPAYMSPEQANGDTGSFGPGTDVYGLGGVLYALMTGRAPFVGDQLPVLLERVRVEKPLPLGPNSDPDLAAICLRCLEKRSGARYPSADALAAALGDYLGQFADLASAREQPAAERTVHTFAPIAPPPT